MIFVASCGLTFDSKTIIQHLLWSKIYKSFIYCVSTYDFLLSPEINLLMRSFERWLNMLWKCFIVYTTRFWKYVWPFSNIVYERDKRVKYLCIWTLINVCIQKSFFDQINIFAFLKIIFFRKIFILMEKSPAYGKVLYL